MLFLATILFLVQDIGAFSIPITIDEALDNSMVINTDCGLYAFSAAAKCTGVNVAVPELADRDYISNQFGSSVEDLLRAAKDYDIDATYYSNLNINPILSSNSPWLVLMEGYSEGHWVAIIGSEGNRIRVFDPFRSKSELLLEAAELQKRFTGVGIEFEKNSIQKSALNHLSTTSQLILFAGMFLTTVLIGKRNGWGVWRMFGGVVFLGILGSLLTNPLSPFTNRTAYAIVGADQSGLPVDEVTLKEIFSHEKCEFVDARHVSDFQRATIPGAISLPVSMPSHQFESELKKLQQDVPCIVFCNQSSCDLSDVVARRLKMFGLDNVFVYRHGFRPLMEEWEKQNDSK